MNKGSQSDISNSEKAKNLSMPTANSKAHIQHADDARLAAETLLSVEINANTSIDNEELVPLNDDALNEI